MRLKIVAGNLIAVLLIGLVSFFVIRTQIRETLSSQVEARIPNDQKLFERSWRLAAIEFVEQVRDRASSPEVRASFGALDEQSRRRRAFEAANDVQAWFRDPARGRHGPPDIVAVTDETGRVLGRSQDVNRMYGQLLVSALPALGQVLRDGIPRHSVWNKEDENKLLQTGMAPIHNDGGAVVGGLVVGYDLSNGLAQAEAQVLGREVIFVVNDKIYSSSLAGDKQDPLREHLFGPMRQTTNAALSGTPSTPWKATIDDEEYYGVIAPLTTSPNTRVAYVVLTNMTKQLELTEVSNIILILMVLGAIMVMVYGFIIGTGFIRPVEEIEEGVLAVINGRTDLRLDVDSAELGGLAYRINQLINVFTGVAEEDEEGRVSQAPASSAASSEVWQGAAFADSGTGGPGSAGAAAAAGADVVDDQAIASQLAAEPEDAYYARIYKEYVDAKRAVGEDVSNIPQDRFVQRLKGNEISLAQKHGCQKVRFQVQTRGGQVILRPVLIR